jgi:predicted CopG family antitoxin
MTNARLFENLLEKLLQLRKKQVREMEAIIKTTGETGDIMKSLLAMSKEPNMREVIKKSDYIRQLIRQANLHPKDGTSPEASSKSRPAL